MNITVRLAMGPRISPPCTTAQTHPPTLVCYINKYISLLLSFRAGIWLNVEVFIGVITIYITVPAKISCCSFLSPLSVSIKARPFQLQRRCFDRKKMQFLSQRSCPASLRQAMQDAGTRQQLWLCQLPGNLT